MKTKKRESLCERVQEKAITNVCKARFDNPFLPHAYLDGGTHSHSLVGVDAFARHAAKEILHNLLHLKGDK